MKNKRKKGKAQQEWKKKKGGGFDLTKTHLDRIGRLVIQVQRKWENQKKIGLFPSTINETGVIESNLRKK